MSEVESYQTTMDGMVAREDTVLLAGRATPVTSMVPAEDRDDHLERVRALRYVERYGKPYMPLINKWRRNRK